ncbi:MAG: putative ATP-dependent endonuclease of OLD family [Afipia broomeae]|uniref:ATP-dependent endonuclease n=1 Tax=Mesorhizobium hungaricum TaxID=1566387 RepID=A0A1C2DMX3_9HYPH|nr:MULTISPECIES: AAA family ATPase [Mesorhizobium]MBN9236974.1 AAA family ATPase [Mesorhizobium sp.]OCX16109.1 ATP-dependent endonuclease [Mesorhizobium hungaricum]
MRLESVTLSGFRCFGPDPITVPIASEITAVVGPNAAGKTALLHGLSKLFGVSRAQRTVQRSDFHVGADDDIDDREPKDLFIDVLIGLPELADGTATPETIAPSFRHMQLERADKAPVCRLRLEARWEDDGTVEGEVSQELFWVDTLDDSPPDDKRHPVSAADRGLIQLYYTPASRDAAAQIRATTGALAARLLRAIEWSSDTEDAVKGASEDLATAFEGEAAIAAIAKALQTRWSDLHDDVVDTKPRLSLVSRRFEEIVSKIAVIFEQGPDGQERGLDALSDGQQSLFYFALAAAVFDLERQVVAGKVEGFLDDQLRIPALTLFALEEPENHLSPYFLARIIRQVRSLTDGGGAQAIVTSHSPAVLSRVNPREVRYCRSDPKTRVSSVKKIKMPTGIDEAAKFVRGAMLAYPELYFARFVLLVEGDSERIVLPRLAEALDLLIDPAFVAIVPLGGRHVQHFWRLLTHLGIPHATLLDLDLGRSGGGFGRVKTAIEKLIEFGVPKANLLKIEGGMLSDADFAKMHTWQDADDRKLLKGWVDCLKPHAVYFSAPLDLDLAMIAAFPDAYEAVIPKGGGPKMAIDKAAEVVLGTAGPGLALYTGPYKDYPDLLPAYRYHFITNSKPATHLAALTHIKTKALGEDMPPLLAELLNHIAKRLRRD